MRRRAESSHAMTAFLVHVRKPSTSPLTVIKAHRDFASNPTYVEGQQKPSDQNNGASQMCHGSLPGLASLLQC